MNRVLELRKRAGMQQKEVAVAVGVSSPTVSEWEHQKKDPTEERILKLASLFGVSTGVILGYDPMPGTAMDSPGADGDAEMWNLRESVRRDPERRELFNLARNADIEQVRQAVAIIDALKRASGGGNNETP